MVEVRTLYIKVIYYKSDNTIIRITPPLKNMESRI